MLYWLRKWGDGNTLITVLTKIKIVLISLMLLEFIVYLFYGLSFFILGFAILLKDKRFSRLEIASILIYLAFFAILHGIHEWLVLYLLTNKFYIGDQQLLEWSRYLFALLLISFLFLFYFGIKSLLIISSLKINKSFKSILVFFMILFALPVYFYSIMINKDSLIRYIFGFSSATLSGIVLIILSFKYAKKGIYGYKNLLICGYLFIGYGIFSGIIVSDIFFDKLIVVSIRGLLAILIFIFLFRFLKVFDNEFIKNIEDSLKKSCLNDRLSSIGKLAMGIAHEINTPLTNATIVLEILKCKFNFDNPEIIEKLNSLEKNIDRAAKIANELLLFSRDEKIELFEVVNISEIIENLKLFIKNHPKFRYVAFAINSDFEFECIPHKIEELLVNLILNAFDATSENPEIVVSANCTDKNVHFNVQDNGIGIDDSIKNKIFDPFFTTKKPNEGTGLGLYLCYNIVKIHKGLIYLEQNENGKTIFAIKIPRYQD